MTGPAVTWTLSHDTYHLIVSVDIIEGRPAAAAAAMPDTPLDVETAAWLPELLIPLHIRGVEGTVWWPSLAVRQLREAVDRGDLRPERHGRKIVVTRKISQEWRERCRHVDMDLFIEPQLFLQIYRYFI